MDQAIQPTKPRLSRANANALWAKLGIAFAEEPALGPVDPEMTLLLSLEAALENRKTLHLITEWLQEYGDLIHVERLLGIVRRDTWHDQEDGHAAVRALAGLADRLTAQGDRRWQVIVRECKARLRGAPVLPPARAEDYQFLIKRDGVDPHFEKFGISLPKFGVNGTRFQRSATKKLRTREHVLGTNPWLRLRALLGANWRADVLFVILAGLATNAHHASRLLGCSYETAHRIWAGAQGAKATELFHVEVLIG